MTLAYVLLGLGIGAGTLLPCSLVVANVFSDQRGRALGLTMAGTTVGGMFMIPVADYIIERHGWRTSYIILAAPMILIALPMVLSLVRTRADRVSQLARDEASRTTPGLGVAEALRARSFWMIAAAQFCFAFAVTGGSLHTIPFLIVIGYSPSRAALVFSLTMGLAAVGKIMMGFLAERTGGRIALAATLVLIAIGQILLIGARNPVMLFGYAAVYGLTSGAPLALIPLQIAESLGLKRFGSLCGLAGVFTTIGAGSGPVVAGFLFDTTKSYRTAFELFALILLLGGWAALFCKPLESAAARPSTTAA
jgi:MFS family permease